jgi:acyl transferase domain-containing protein
MTALEATGTDPQQRLMLEVAYEALENGQEISMNIAHAMTKQSIPAGIPIHDVVGTKTGVYVGCFTNDFESVGGRDPCMFLSEISCLQTLILYQVGGPFYAATGYGSRYI